MKTLDLEKILISKGFINIRKNAHKVWTNGIRTLTTPHHRSVNIFLAKKILKQAGYYV